jgi:hypothetical protein
MKNTTMFICQLPINEQQQIRELLLNCQALENEDNKIEIIENAMNDRICLLEDFINLELIIPNNLKTICKQWEYDFKGDLLENIDDILEVHGTIKNYIQYLINEALPVWIEENKDNAELYKNYQIRLKNIVNEL